MDCRENKNGGGKPPPYSIYLLLFVFLKKLPISRHAHKNRLSAHIWLANIGVETIISNAFIRLPTASPEGNVSTLAIISSIVSTKDVIQIPRIRRTVFLSFSVFSCLFYNEQSLSLLRLFYNEQSLPSSFLQ